MNRLADPLAVAGGYDDPHGLFTRDLGSVRLLVLEGRSGSGKSTAIRALVEHHPSFRGLARTEVSGAPIAWGAVRVQTPLVVIDELVRLADVPGVLGLLLGGRRAIVASHLPGGWLALIGARCGVCRVVTDRDPRTVERYLRGRGVRFTPAAVDRFCRRFGATYTDARIVLEHCGGSDFDRALARFEACCAVRMTPLRRETRVTHAGGGTAPLAADRARSVARPRTG